MVFRTKEKIDLSKEPRERFQFTRRSRIGTASPQERLHVSLLPYWYEIQRH